MFPFLGSFTYIELKNSKVVVSYSSYICLSEKQQQFYVQTMV